jgi:ATP-dependent RNA helicase DDX24/MAK5
VNNASTTTKYYYIMAASDQKKALPPKIAAMKARKRQKVDSPAVTERPAKKAKTNNTRKPVRLDNLPWKDVDMPDRMDDYEGFFGLEEIDDVEVLRDEATGKVSYISRHEANAEESDDYPSDSEEFTGFEDEETEVPEPASIPADEVELKKGGKEVDVPEPVSVPADEVKVKQDKKEKKEKEKKEKKEKKAKAETKAKTQQKVLEKAAAPSATGAFETLEAADEDEDVDMSEWLPLKLSPDTMAALAKLKFKKPSNIQSAAIPEILEGHDVIGKASTGSGKTLAFGIPILERFLEHRAQPQKAEHKWPLALILSPTRELAHQLSDHLEALCSTGVFRGPQIATITGGLSVQKQQRQLKDADIIVGTPGRLWEVISDGHGLMDALKHLQFLVVDEADRLLGEGHFKEVGDILDVLDRQVINSDDAEPSSGVPQSQAQIQSERQTLVFSATFDKGLQKKLSGKAKPNKGGGLLSNKESLEFLLKKLNFREETPKFVDVNPVHQMATGLKEGMIECGGTEKDLYLYTLLLHYRQARTLVFCNSISAVKRITPFLQNLELPALALHSGMIQKQRLRSVERFKETKPGAKSASILVATDVAARGLDIPNVQLVVHYHLPRAADTYVHRSGRTARAGQQGSSILICGPEEVNGVRRLIANVHAKTAVSHEDNATLAAKQGYYIRSLDMDRRIVSRLRERAQLAKKLADMNTSKMKRSKEDDFMRAAAEELGVDYDSEEFEKEAPGKHGRGANRKKKEKEAANITKGEAAGMRAELRELLRQRVNVGVSEKYLTSGKVDIDELLRQKELGEGKTGEFLGGAGGLGLEDL